MPVKNRKYYKELIKNHKRILSKARNLISIMLDQLEEDICNHQEQNKNNDAEDKANNHHKFWWGDKESASSILTRLTQLLLKLIPIEQEIARIDLTKADLTELEDISEKIQINEDDLEIINHYVEKYRNYKNI
jgi:hypothetical protein